jgi:hypothetical protein
VFATIKTRRAEAGGGLRRTSAAQVGFARSGYIYVFGAVCSVLEKNFRKNFRKKRIQRICPEYSGIRMMVRNASADGGGNSGSAETRGDTAG